MRNFRELIIWQKGMEIAKSIYSITQHLPDYEKFALQNQLIRASVSIPSNIAEGCGKSSDKDFKRYLEIALGSAYEIETQLILVNEIHKIDTQVIIDKILEEEEMLVSLINKIKSNCG